MERIGSACHGEPICMEIYSAESEPLGYEDDVDQLASHLKAAGGIGVAELTICEANPRHLAGSEHDRYWRAWTGRRSATFTLSDSVRVFSAPSLLRAMQYSYHVDLTRDGPSACLLRCAVSACR